MSNTLIQIALLANVVSTVLMVGVIWFVQVVHYPLFALANRDAFADCHAAHTTATTRVVALPMIVEALTALALAWSPPDANLAPVLWTALALVVVLWLSTAILQVPSHRSLGTGFDPLAHKSLVRGNWIRTVAWTARGALLMYVLWQTLAGGQGHGS
jgi:hypothetical protein